MISSDFRVRIQQANLALAENNLVALTWGNVSGIDRNSGLVAIKPSGVTYRQLKPEDLVVVDLEGRIIEGNMNPSSDTPTHLELYRAFPEIGGIVHAHSEYATMFAQAFMEIPCLGTTHADHFHGPVPLTRLISPHEVKENYEANTGKVIIERFQTSNPMETPAVLVPGHGAFTWGRSPEDALNNCIALEKVAKMAWGTFSLPANRTGLPDYLLNKHYSRKHGPDAYYGQKKKE